MSNALEIAVNKQVPTVGHALKALASMERELTAAKTYDGIRKIIKQATALKVLLGHVDEVKQRAEDTILVASMRIGEEIKKVPKASGGDRRSNLPARGDLKNGREQLDVPRTSRSRLTKLADAGKAAVKKAAEQLRHEGKDATPRAVAILLTQGDKKERRDERERELGAKQRALPQKRYGCLLIDPPYRFEVHSRETGMDRSADNHYPTMTIQELMLLPVSSVAAADSVMFLWATAPHLANAIALMAHWGFAYKSRCVWVKDKAGTGYWFRDLAEELLVGTRGRIPAPAQGDQYGGAIEAPVGRHSVKPVCFHEMIEDLFPNLPKLEMFARQQRDGWDCWGNEVDSRRSA